MSRHFLAVVLAGLVSAAAIPAFASPLPVTITLTETGTGSFVCTATCSPLPFVVAPDPGPGGLSAALTYTLPFLGVQGDVLLLDTFPDCFGCVLDVLRFNGDGTAIFYSDNIDGFDSLADTPFPPFANYANFVTIDETGSETFNFAVYAPGPLDPGFGADSYNFISDAPVPEPATLVLLGAGLLGLGGLLRRKRVRS